ncbi:MAG: succinylglutamate desuccinylase/aspartoacylase family protein, partial [Rubrivivax sp.]
MQTQIITLLPAAPGIEHRLTVLRFGTPGSGPKALIQAALHADEIPALLVAQQLRQKLTQLEAAGGLRGQVLLVPYANPVGLAQQPLGLHQGRFDLRDGLNFNRGFADLAPAAASTLAG